MFKNRKDAGRQLASALSEYNNSKNAVILGIPRGGVVVANEVSKILNIPLDIIVIRKIGSPGNEELALGAAGISSFYINEEVAGAYKTNIRIMDIIKKKQQEVKERYKLLAGKRPMIPLKAKTVILIDDGLATGSTMMLAVKVVRKEGPAKIIVAVPVAPLETIARLRKAADDVVCLLKPVTFMAIGQFYKNFSQTSDTEVIGILS